jgi:SNF2 family DNA or RNA helicase
MHIKGQEIAAWNIPANHGFAIVYGTANRGACHQVGPTVEEQQRRTMCDTIVICRFLYYGIGTALFQKALNLVTGWKLDDDAFFKVADRIWNQEKVFNAREGFRRVDDYVPKRMTTDAFTAGPKKGAILPPDKQEQIVEVELNAGHRRAYQTLLNRERRKILGLLDDLDDHRIEVLRSLTLLRQAAIDPSLVDDANAKVPSTKLDAVAELLDDAIAEGHRVLVFSQFTRFLGKVRERLAAAGVDCCYLDGRTRNRADVIESFRAGAAPVFLISLKAGGFGLNLTEADYCVVLDPWWNPAAELQAVDRAHRIGQTRKVMVYRLVAKDTIEEKVMALQAEKSALFAGVTGGAEFAAPQLDAAAIRGLLAG